MEEQTKQLLLDALKEVQLALNSDEEYRETATVRAISSLQRVLEQEQMPRVAKGAVRYAVDEKGMPRG